MQLRELREAKGLTQYRAAKDLGVDRAVWHRWETGKRLPTSTTLVRLADYFGVTVDALLGRSPINAA